MWVDGWMDGWVFGMMILLLGWLLFGPDNINGHELAYVCMYVWRSMCAYAGSVNRGRVGWGLGGKYFCLKLYWTLVQVQVSERSLLTNCIVVYDCCSLLQIQMYLYVRCKSMIVYVYDYVCVCLCILHIIYIVRMFCKEIYWILFMQETHNFNL